MQFDCAIIKYQSQILMTLWIFLFYAIVCGSFLCFCEVKHNFLLNFRIVLEADALSVVQRVALRTEDIPLGEQTVAQVTFYNIIHLFPHYVGTR